MILSARNEVNPGPFSILCIDYNCCCLLQLINDFSKSVFEHSTLTVWREPEQQDVTV